jgi:hypothetical protein
VFRSTNSKLLSKCTKREPSILLRNKYSVGGTVVYRTEDSTIKSFNSVCNQINMRRLTKGQKRKYILSNKSIRKIHINEMITRLHALVIKYDASATPTCNHPLEDMSNFIKKTKKDTKITKSWMH